MRTTILVLVVVFFLIGMGAWLWGGSVRGSGAAALGTLPATSTSATVPTTETPATSPVTNNGPATLDGTAIMDDSQGTPAVPYIKYTDANGNVATKQLIFANSRGCLPNAGDIPCVPSYPVSSAYPKLVTGQSIHVEGYIRENRFLVTDISVQA